MRQLCGNCPPFIAATDKLPKLWFTLTVVPTTPPKYRAWKKYCNKNQNKILSFWAIPCDSWLPPLAPKDNVDVIPPPPEDNVENFSFEERLRRQLAPTLSLGRGGNNINIVFGGRGAKKPFKKCCNIFSIY